MWVLFLLLSAAPTWAASDGWKEGGATYFDAPAYWKAAFVPRKFGDLYGNSCGYVDRTAGEEPSDASFPFPFDAVGAVSDSMPEHPGSCGRCYEIRCKTGLVLSGDGRPASIHEGYYLPTYAPDLLDPEGRPWPGKPKKYAQMKYTQCREGAGSIVITIIDSCPCVYIGGRKQLSCCGPLPHFDLSFWAFDKLAHPLYGNMQIEYRPVDCITHKPLDLEKPFVSDTLYEDGPGAGWGWRTYGEQKSTLLAQHKGIDNSTATCVDLTPSGGSTLIWGCEKEGLQPFNNKTAIEFWIQLRSKEVTTKGGKSMPGSAADVPGTQAGTPDDVSKGPGGEKGVPGGSGGAEGVPGGEKSVPAGTLWIEGVLGGEVGVPWSEADVPEAEPGGVEVEGGMGLQMFLSQMHNLVYNETGSFREPSTFCDDKPVLVNYMPAGGADDWVQIQIPLASFRCGRVLDLAKVNKIVIENPTERNVEFCLDEFRIV